jgi:hypothetical protein
MVKCGAPPNNDDDGSRARNFAVVEKVWSLWVESTSASRVMVNFAVRLRELEPKIGLDLTAFDGFFST